MWFVDPPIIFKNRISFYYEIPRGKLPLQEITRPESVVELGRKMVKAEKEISNKYGEHINILTGITVERRDFNLKIIDSFQYRVMMGTLDDSEESKSTLKNALEEFLDLIPAKPINGSSEKSIFEFIQSYEPVVK